MLFNYIEKFLEVTKILECPTSYLEWAAYITLSSVMRHNVYIDLPSRRTKITPNIYVLLVGDSGATRKSSPLKIVNFLLKKIGNTKIIEGRASIQGVLKELAAVKRIDRRVIKNASALLYSEEFSSFLVRDTSVTPILTDLYDYKQEHSIILKTEDIVKLEEVCINLFAATNGAFLQGMFTKEDIYGGLCGRTIFIVEEKARHKDLGLRDETNEEDWNALLNHLFYLASVEGSVILEPDALLYVEEWYNSTNFSLYESRTGYEHRAHTHALKLAMILSSAEEGFCRIIRKEHCEKSIDIVTRLRKNYHKLVAMAGFSQDNVRQAIKDITLCLFQNVDKPLSRDEIFRMLFGRIDGEAFEKAISTLDQTGFITVTGTSKPFYQLSEKGREAILGEIKFTETKH